MLGLFRSDAVVKQSRADGIGVEMNLVGPVKHEQEVIEAIMKVG